MLEKLIKNKYVKSAVLVIASIPLLVNIANSETLLEKLKPYLINGKPKQEYLEKKYLFIFDGNITFNEFYRIENNEIVLQYGLAPFLTFNPEYNTYTRPIAKNPYGLIFNGDKYFDNKEDGINGNEVMEKIEDKIKENKGKIEL